MKDRRWRVCCRDGRLAEGLMACCRDGRPAEGQKESFAAGIEDRLKDRRWKACYRDGKLAEE